MRYPNYNTFIHAIRGKVIMALLLGCVALILAWGVGKVAFKEMQNSIKAISAPNERLRLVNNIFREITKLDQMQRVETLSDKTTPYGAFTESKLLLLAMDSLQQLYPNNSAQTKRIVEMKRILHERDHLFVNYLKVRQGLVNSKAFSEQIRTLSALINKSSAITDSTVIATEKKSSTMLLLPPDSTQKEEAPSKGFFSRIFGKKKSTPKLSDLQRVIKEEINVKVDTLARASQDSVIREVEKAIQDIDTKQRERSDKFIRREIQLANAGNVLVNQMLSTLQEVEREVVKQVNLNNSNAQQVVNTSVNRMTIIMLAFLLLTLVLLYFILTDISKSNDYRKRLEVAKDEAEYHSMAKQRFLSNMSHEIRTPLQSIIGYAEQVREQPVPQKQDIEAIYQSAEHLLHITNEVLDYSRIISGKYKFESSVFSINQLLENVIAVMQAQAAVKSLQLSLKCDTNGFDLIEGDPFRLKQILFNLLGNAIKFTAHGSVRLSVTGIRNGEMANFRFSVKDTGEGIAKESVGHIFKEFEQAETSIAGKHSGTGLGLSIVKSLTEGQGGDISVESELGKGSCFTVNIQYKIAVQDEKGPSLNKTGYPIPYKGKVWVVDDDRFILQLCAAIFDKHGINNQCFNLPATLLAAPWDAAVDTYLVDMRMPGMSGPELCKALRKRINGNARIFALTAQALPEERESIINEGFDGLLMKPFRETDLLALLQSTVPVLAGPLNVADKHTGDEIPAQAASLDLSMLRKMTFGDETQLHKILHSFIIDTNNDMQELSLAASVADSEQGSLLLHRLAGRTAQIGAKELAAELRIQEIKLRKSNTLGTQEMDHIKTVLHSLELLIKQVHQEMNAA